MEIFKIGFLSVRLLDVIDILIVAFLLYKVYELLKGGVAINIFIGLLSIYVLWWLCVRILEMQLLGSILGQFVGVGVIALIIVFQQEVRRFLVLLGTSNIFTGSRIPRPFRKWSIQTVASTETDPRPVVKACVNMSKSGTGALIVVQRNTDLRFYASTGDQMNATVSKRLIESIFFKNSPMHDGAIIIHNNIIVAARCVLPVTDNPDIPGNYGMRHRAALGISEQSDALAIVVSEETGSISVAAAGDLRANLNQDDLQEILSREL